MTYTSTHTFTDKMNISNIFLQFLTKNILNSKAKLTTNEQTNNQPITKEANLQTNKQPNNNCQGLNSSPNTTR